MAKQFKYEVKTTRIKIRAIEGPNAGKVTEFWGVREPDHKEAQIVTKKDILDAGASEEFFQLLLSNGDLEALKGSDYEEPEVPNAETGKRIDVPSQAEPANAAKLGEAGVTPTPIDGRCTRNNS